MGDMEGDAATRRVTWRPGDGDRWDGAAGEWAHGCRQDLALSGPDGEEAPAVSLAAGSVGPPVRQQPRLPAERSAHGRSLGGRPRGWRAGGRIKPLRVA
jgi:hypothetical protein